MNRVGLKYRAIMIVLGCVCCGCQSRPNSAEVSGVVTLDGEPLPKADVVFTPGDGRSSLGITDQEGKYSLVFTGLKTGAMPGTHRVSITTAVIDLDGDGFQAKEVVPAKYRGPESELIQEVKPGRNTINFSLHTR